MSWLFEHEYIETPGNPFDAVQVGRFLWVSTTNNQIKVYELSGEASNFEPAWETLDELNGGWGSKTLRWTIDVPEGCYWLAKSTGSVYATNKASNFTKISRIGLESRTVDELIETPLVHIDGIDGLVNQPMNSNIVYENNRVWMVSTAKKDELPNDRQKVYTLGGPIGRRNWSTVEIPTKKQFVRAMLCSGYNGSVYITNFNNVSVSKFNAQTFTFDKFIRVNAFPQQIWASSNRDIFVASYGGMLSRIDPFTDEVFNAHSTIATATSLAPMPDDYVWFTSMKSVHPGEEMKFNDATVIGRVNRNDNSVRFSGKSKKKIDQIPSPPDKEASYIAESTDTGSSVGNTNASAPNESPDPTKNTPITTSINYEIKGHDWNIDTADIGFSRCLVTIPFQYKKFNGTTWETIDVKPYLIMIGSSMIKFVRLYREFCKVDKLEINGQAMISTGSEDYIGDIATEIKETAQ